MTIGAGEYIYNICVGVCVCVCRERRDASGLDRHRRFTRMARARVSFTLLRRSSLRCATPIIPFHPSVRLPPQRSSTPRGHPHQLPTKSALPAPASVVMIIFLVAVAVIIIIIIVCDTHKRAHTHAHTHNHIVVSSMRPCVWNVRTYCVYMRDDVNIILYTATSRR